MWADGPDAEKRVKALLREAFRAARETDGVKLGQKETLLIGLASCTAVILMEACTKSSVQNAFAKRSYSRFKAEEVATIS